MPTFPDHPPLMVVGDSLAQGCRSLSVTGEFCAQSCGARVAAEMKWPFHVPDYPRPVIFNLERIIRNLPVITGPFLLPLAGGALREMRENIHFWAQRFAPTTGAIAGQRPWFDNLGETGAKFSDLLTRTARQCDETITEIVALNGPRAMPPLKKLGDLHLAILARFVLNPANRTEFARLSAFDLVERRQPERLVVQVGHNHGLYAVGGSGHPAISFDQEFWSGVEETAGRLAALPKATKEIYWFLLPKVSAVANLQPSGTPDADGYAEAYEPVFSLSAKTIERAAMRRIDAAIQRANARIEETLRTAAQKQGTEERLCIIDTYAIFDDFDFKNRRAPHYLVPAGKGTISNEALQGRWDAPARRGPRNRPDPRRKYRLHAGGFQSIDGMHPSGAGYAMVAAQLLARMWHNVDVASFVGAALNQDSLLTQYAANLDLVHTILAAIRSTARRQTPAQAKQISDVPDPEANDAHLAQIVRVATGVVAED